MLSRCRARNAEICVVRVDAGVLDQAGVIVTDRNAASGWARFWSVAAGLPKISRDRVLARYWTHRDDPYEEMSHKSEKCAEVLVPDRVEVRLIIGACVANQAAQQAFQQLKTGLSVQIRGELFF